MCRLQLWISAIASSSCCALRFLAPAGVGPRRRPRLWRAGSGGSTTTACTTSPTSTSVDAGVTSTATTVSPPVRQRRSRWRRRRWRGSTTTASVSATTVSCAFGIHAVGSTDTRWENSEASSSTSPCVLLIISRVNNDVDSVAGAPADTDAVADAAADVDAVADAAADADASITVWMHLRESDTVTACPFL